MRTGRDGTVALRVNDRSKLRLTVSAKRYGSRTVRIDLGHGLRSEVRIWQPALQWPIYGATRARTQAHPALRVRPPFRFVWHRSFAGLIEFPAMVWNGVAYVNVYGGNLRAISMRTGHVLWRRRVGTRMASSPGLDPERGILVTTSMSPGYVNVISMATGRIRWRYYTGRAEPSPVIRDGVAYFGAANGNVYALDLDRRKPRWIYHGGVKVTSSPALVGNRLFYGDYAGRVFALDARTGRRIWTGSAGSRVYGTVAVAKGRVFVPSVFSGLSALSARTGRLLWRIPVADYVYSSPAFFRNRVYFGTFTWRVVCADARSGRIIWSRPTYGAVSGAVEVVAGVVYAATVRERMYAYDWRSGRLVWRFPHGAYVPVSGSGSRLLIHGKKEIWAVEGRRPR